MRISPWSGIIVSALILALVAPAAARPEEEQPKTKIQKRQPAPVAAAPKAQTQTAPAAPGGKRKPQTPPAEAGVQNVQGTVVQVIPERHAIIVRTTTNDFQIFVTPETVLLRDGQRVEIQMILPGDRVESCQFNSKHVIRKMTVIGTGKALAPQPPSPSPKP